jgi:hypothetical protein
VHRIADAEPVSPVAYTAAILDEQARRDDERTAEKPVVFADDLLPGVGDTPLSFREGLAKGGLYTYVVLTILNSLDELESGVFNVLGPDIQDTFGVSDGTIAFLGTASIAFFVLGAAPMGWLADRTRRPPIVGFASLVFGAVSVLCGLDRLARRRQVGLPRFARVVRVGCRGADLRPRRPDRDRLTTRDFSRTSGRGNRRRRPR